MRDELFDADGRPVRRKPPRFTDEPPPSGPSVDDLILDNGGISSMIAVRERQGGPVLNLLPTGAVVTNNGTGPVFHYAPEPVGGLANLKARRRYHAVCLARDEVAFAKCKAALLGPGSDDHPVAPYQWSEKAHGPIPGLPGACWLERIKEFVTRHRAAVAELDRLIAATPEERARRSRERESREVDAMMAEREQNERAGVKAVTLGE